MWFTSVSGDDQENFVPKYLPRFTLVSPLQNSSPY